MKKLISLAAVLICSACFTFISHADDEVSHRSSTINGYTAILHDEDNSISDDTEEAVFEKICNAVGETELNIGVVITDNVNGSDDFIEIISRSDEYYNDYFGADADGILLFLNNDTYLNWISTGGSGNEIYMEVTAQMMTDMSESMSNADFPAVIDIFCADAVKYYSLYEEKEDNTDTETINTVDFTESSYEEGKYTVAVGSNTALLHDLDNSLTTEEEVELIDELISTVQYTDFSVAVVITDNIGQDKSDYQVMDFADVYYEEHCGINTDGILLLLNNDTKYDWISTSGSCINTFNYSIDYIFDDIWDYVTDAEYANAVSGFCSSVIYYSDNLEYSGGDDYYYHDDFSSYSISGIIEGVFSLLIFAGFFVAVALVIFAGIIKSGYKLQKNRSVADYILKDSMVLTQQTDTYLRTYTTRTRVSSSSSSGHRSGGSRSHRSSGGGRHGGGGRRR